MRIVQVTWSLLCADVSECLASLGHDVVSVPQAGPGLTERLAHALRANQADLLFSLNFNPHYAAVAHQTRRPYAAWNIDNVCSSAFCAPRFALPHTHLFCIDRPSLDLYRRAGYPNLHYLPIGSNLARFQPPPDDDILNKERAVSFVGCSMIRQGNEYPGFLAGLRRQRDAITDPRTRQVCQATLDAIEAIVEAECRDYFRSSLSERLAEASRRLGFDLASTLYHDPPFFGMLLGKEISSRKRLDLIRRLGEKLPVNLFGDDDWRILAGGLIRYRGKADYRADTPTAYRQSAINLNIEKVYNTSSINIRIVDAMACGGFVLTEAVEDLPRFFEAGRDLETFSSLPELLDKAAYYLDHEHEREAIARSGCQKVRATFSLAGRLKDLLAAIPIPPRAGPL